MTLRTILLHSAKCALLSFLIAAGSGSVDAAPENDGVTALAGRIARAGREGAGADDARSAWRELVEKSKADSIPAILGAIDAEAPIGANWLRSAVDAIAERTLAARGKLPVDALDAFVRDTGRDASARRLAYDWLTAVDPSAVERLIPGMLDDPAPAFRRDAVARLLHEIEEGEATRAKEETTARYEAALLAALDPKQVREITKRLRKLGREVDVARHFGFILDWHLVGPFDSTKNEAGVQRGYAAEYAPETIVPLRPVHFESKYDGKHGPVQWKKHVTTDEYGIVDLNREIAHEKGVAAYAATEFTSARAREAEIRIGTENAFKLWLNGELIFARDEYHHGTRIDHYRGKGRLRAGGNTILIKSCQNEQTEDWADPWQFQLRVCDAKGSAILSATRPERPRNEAKEKKE